MVETQSVQCFMEESFVEFANFLFIVFEHVEVNNSHSIPTGPPIDIISILMQAALNKSNQQTGLGFVLS